MKINKNYKFTEFNEKTISVFKAIKNETYSNEKDFVIPVANGKEKVANLRPITKRYLEDTEENIEIIKLLAEWRETNQEWFDMFNVSVEGTKEWLKKNVIDIENRILFLVETTDGNPFGHMGLFRGEADNFIRGRNDLIKGGMTSALKTMLSWAFAELELNELYLRVFSDNKKAIAYYERCGFKQIGLIPLRKIEKAEITRWEAIEEGDKKEADRYFSLMKSKNPNSNKIVIQEK